MWSSFALQVLPYSTFAFLASLIVAQYFRARAKQRAYLRRFPAVNGVRLDVRLDMYVPGTSAQVRRAVFKALRDRQADPELETLRREVRRNGYSIFVLAVIVPLIILSVWGLLALLGSIHY